MPQPAGPPALVVSPKAYKLSQERVAKILKTSQGRVSKLEKGQATLDQLGRSVLALGGSTKEVAQAISGGSLR